MIFLVIMSLYELHRLLCNKSGEWCLKEYKMNEKGHEAQSEILTHTARLGHIYNRVPNKYKSGALRLNKPTR
jgi:hypothetical protein